MKQKMKSGALTLKISLIYFFVRILLYFKKISKSSETHGSYPLRSNYCSATQKVQMYISDWYF